MPSVVFSLLLALAAPTNSPSAEFARGKLAFQRAEYARTIDVLRPLLYPETRLETEGEIVQAHRMLGIAHLFQGQQEHAAEEFRKLLQLRPYFRMDALIDPPRVVDFFNSILSQQEAELANLEKQRRQAEVLDERRKRTGAQPCPEPTVLERRTIRNSRAVSFIPFGAGQFQNGHSRKGWSFFAAETVLGAISLGALTTNFALYGARPTLSCEWNGDTSVSEGNCPPGYALSKDQARSQLLLRVQLVSGALFFATAIWGVTDAILHFQPEVVVTTPMGPTAREHTGAESDGDSDRDAGRGEPRAKTARSKTGAHRPPRAGISDLRVAPGLLFSGGLGGTLAFRF